MTCWKTPLSTLPAALLVGLAGLVPSPVQASPVAALLPLATLSVVDTTCGAPTAAPRQNVAGFASAISKSSAILSGSISALDRIRMQQQAGLAGETRDHATPAVGTPLRPATMCPVTAFVAQPAIVRRSTPVTTAPTTAPSDLAIATPNDNFLATRRIAIGKTPFDRQWSRVVRARLSAGQVHAALGPRPASGLDAMSRVNSWVNTKVRPVDDRTARHAADHWASAGQTLSRRSGDCEDFAILKYQMLAALGVDRQDMYLTLARDLVRNADHAVLIVRHEGRFYMLDNATNALLDATEAHDYRAMMSFTEGRAFLHGVHNPA